MNLHRMFMRKLLSIILIVSFLLPSFSALAQESTSETTTPSEPASSEPAFDLEPTPEDTIDTESNPFTLPEAESTESIEPTPELETPAISEEESLTPEEVEETPIEEDPPMSLLDEDDGEDENISQYGGTKSILPEVDQSSGALTYTYPIEVPPGRNGLRPDLNLSYNNQKSSNIDNLFGYGWTVSIPYIERVNKTGVEKIYTDNYFQSSLSGELVQISSGSYGPKIDTSDFFRYTFDEGTWSLTDKSGTTYLFGQTASAQQDKTSQGKKYKWMLQKVTDTNGNHITYEYFKNAGQIYPATVSWTGYGADKGIYKAVFERESRSDNDTYYTPGFSVKNNYRINRIQINVNGQWVRRYNLGYTTGDNSRRSLLETIEKQGRSENGTTLSIPAVYFEYDKPTIGWQTTSEGWGATSDGEPYDNYKELKMLGDVNANGFMDIIYSYVSCFGCGIASGTYRYNEAVGDFGTMTQFIPPVLFYSGSYRTNSLYNDKGVRADDFNGDFKTDLYSYSTHEHAPGKQTYLNNGTGWTASSSWLPNVPIIESTQRQTQIFDSNGDGLPEVMQSNRPSGDCSNLFTRASMNTGFGWASSSYAPSVALNEGIITMDVNGDGLNDLVQAYEAGSVHPCHTGNPAPFRKVFINTGSSSVDTWQYDSNWTVPSVLFGSTLYNLDSGARVADINGDNLPDIISGATVYINNGSSWSGSSGWQLPSAVAAGDDKRFMDFTGDGMVDLSDISGGARINKGKKADQLKLIRTPQGGKTNIAYQGSHKYRDANNASLNQKLPIVISTVKAVGFNALYGPIATTSYQYENGDYYYNGPFDRRVPGFGKVTSTDLDGNKTITYFHQGNTSSSAWEETNDHFSKIGKPFRTDVFDISNNLYKRTWNSWTNTSLGQNRWLVTPNSTQEQIYDGNSTHKDSAATYTYESSTGNLTQKVELGQVSGSSTTSTYSDTGTDKFTTDYTYTASGSIQLPKQITKNDQNSAKVNEIKNYYDNQAHGTALKGNLTKQEQWKSSSSYIDVEKTYNSYGLVTQEKDPRDKTASYSYDSYNLFPTRVENALDQLTQYTYDYSSGKVKLTTDPNGLLSSRSYEPLDRVSAEGQSDVSSPSTINTKTTYTYLDFSGAGIGSTSMSRFDHLDGSTSAASYLYFDGLGRKAQERREGEGSNYSVTNYTYNNKNLPARIGRPYFSSGSALTAIDVSNAQASYSYDPLYRVKTLGNDIGTTTYTYDDWKVTETDPRGNPKHLHRDAYNNLIKVAEINNSQVATTSYEYNGNNKLTKITDARGNLRNFTYDGLGRRLTAEDLHSSASSGGSWYATGGTWTNRQLVTIDHTKIPGSTALTNFPILISITDNALKASASGGYVKKSGGKDVLFTLDHSAKLSHEIEKYDGTTGNLIAWVKISSLSATASTSIYMYYGNQSSSDQQDTTNVWDSNYKGVWHLKESSSCPVTITDSTSNALNASCASSPTYSSSGKIGGSRSGDGSDDALVTGSRAVTSNYTVSMWYKAPAAPSSGNWDAPLTWNSSNDQGIAFNYDATDAPYRQAWSHYDSGYTALKYTTSLQGSTWYHMTIAYDGTTARAYLNGSQEASATVSAMTDSGTERVNILAGIGGTSDFDNGEIDEVRISDTARSADWIAAEYNNQNSPSTFYTVGSTNTQSGGSVLTWTYTYDDSGNETSVVDPKSQTINHTYDDLNRVATEDYTGSAGTEITFAYDTCTYGKGRLCKVLSSEASTSWQYNGMGLPSSERKKIDAITYQTSYTYDRQGNTLTITSPDSSQVKYIYNSAGMLEQIQRKENSDGGFTDVISDFDYIPTGKIEAQEFANCVITENTHDATKLYRLTRIHTYKDCGGLAVMWEGLGALELALASESLSLVASESLGIQEESKPVQTKIVSDLLENKTAQEKATIKGQEIAKLGFISRTQRSDYDIEVVSMRPIEKGVEVFARAWNKNGQIGFGRDGSIEIERFVIINPPILVPDSEGIIQREWTDPNTKEKKTRKLREDTTESLLQIIEHAMKLKRQKFGSKNIINGKIGNTTSIIYSNGDPEINSVDGTIEMDNGSNGSIWSAIHDASAGTTAVSNATAGNYARVYGTGTSGNPWRNITRGFILFDTSVISDNDTKDSATLSIYGNNVSNMHSQSLEIVSSTPASNIDLVTGDYDQLGTTQFATPISFGSWNTSGYNNFTLNSSGRANISLTGISKFGTRTNSDRANTAPTTMSGDHNSYAGGYFTDQTGTTTDPKLVVEHTYTSPISSGSIQDINYTYDTNNNITRIVNLSENNSNRITGYDYDALNRLIVASSSNTFYGDNYVHRFAYDAIGNITSKSDQGAYTYADTSDPYKNPQALVSIEGTGGGTATTSEEMLDVPWNLSGNNGADEEYQGVDEDILLGKESITVTYDLNGLCALGNDASAIIFDQSDWRYVSLSDYGTNCYDGTQVVTIPLDDFPDLDINEPLTGDLHSRFWYSSAFSVDITSITINSVASSSTDATFTYDNNGNVTTYTNPNGTTTTLTWDYDNKVQKATGGGASASYDYDHTGQRIKVKNASETRHYPSKFYNIAGSIPTKHIFTPDGTLVATIINSNASASIHYVHVDHLGGMNVVTNSSGQQEGISDYYAYGEIRVDTGSFNEQRRYTGHEYDSETDLNYMNARYQSGKWGRFVSQDNVFQALGSERSVESLTRKDQREVLSDPQLLNGYSYGRNNPISYVDRAGNSAALAVPLLIGTGAVSLTPVGWALIGGTAILSAGYLLHERGWVKPQIPDVKWPAPARDVEDFIRNMKPGNSDWLKWAVGGAISSGLITDKYDEFKNFMNFTQRFNDSTKSSILYMQSQKGVSYGQNNTYSGSLQSLIQANQTIVNSYNSNVSSQNNQVWVAPSGGVFTWDGQVVVPPPSNWVQLK